MLKRTIIAVLVGGALTAPALASERCTEQPKSQWLSQDQIAERLKAQGIEVTRTETKRSCYEVKGRDREGRRVELHVDPATARIVKRETKDERS